MEVVPKAKRRQGNGFPQTRLVFVSLLFATSTAFLNQNIDASSRKRKHCFTPRHTLEMPATRDSSMRSENFEVTKKPRQKKSEELLSRNEMFDHENLSREEEQELGMKIRKAITLKEQIRGIVEEKEMHEFGRFVKRQEYQRRLLSGSELGEIDGAAIGLAETDLDYMSTQGIDGSFCEEKWRSKHELKSNIRVQSMDDYFEEVNFASSVANSFEDHSDSPVLTDDDLTSLGISGGRETISRILIDGAVARDKIIRSNIRLVLSIAKKWCQTNSPISGQVQVLYEGTASRPSLDEAVQEGIVGLAAAADRFDYTRKLRFSTYATYWITNSIRICFRDSLTGSLRIPMNYHDTLFKYQKLVNSHYRKTGEMISIIDAANIMEMKPERLDVIVRTTKELVSLDAPIGHGAQKALAGKAGGTDDVSADHSLANTLSCKESTPEEKVELSILRQCLENALSAELSPHERDVIRLRYGLDDGSTRSVRETSELLTVTARDVRRTEKIAFRKLRSPYAVDTYNLLGFLNFVDGIDSTEFSRRAMKNMMK